MNPRFILYAALFATSIAVGYAVWQTMAEPLPDKPIAVVLTQLGKQELRFAAGAPQLAYLRIEPVVKLPVPLLEPLNGRIAYDEDHTARISTPVAGRVLKIAVQAGDRVAAGQPLLWLDSPEYAQALADLRRADSDARTKQAALSRAQTLFNGGVLARKDLEGTENDSQAAHAEAERARSRFHNLNPDFSMTGGFALRAPLSGIVTERQANPGSEARPDAPAPLFVISDPTHLWAVAELPEKDLDKVRVSQQVAIEVDAYPGQRFSGRVRGIGDVLDPVTRRVIVRCQVDNPERRLKPEMFAHIVPESTEQRLPQVPNAALVSEGLHTFVFVETSPGIIQKRAIELAYRGHEVSFASAGLDAGERLVVSGALLLNAELGN